MIRDARRLACEACAIGARVEANEGHQARTLRMARSAGEAQLLDHIDAGAIRPTPAGHVVAVKITKHDMNAQDRTLQDVTITGPGIGPSLFGAQPAE